MNEKQKKLGLAILTTAQASGMRAEEVKEVLEVLLKTYPEESQKEE